MILSQSSSDQSGSTGEGCGVDWVQNGQSSPHLLAADGVSAVTMILAIVGVFVVGCLGWEDVIYIIGGFLSFNKSSFLTFCFYSRAGIGVSSLWLGPGSLDLGEAVFCYSLLILSSSAYCLHSLFWILLIFSLSSQFVLLQLSSEDQSVNGAAV